MTYEALYNDWKNAMKEGDILRKNTLSSILSEIKNESIKGFGRVEITETLVDKVLRKYEKTVYEMINTCPQNRTDLLKEYNDTLNIIKEYSPKVDTNYDSIKTKIVSLLMSEPIINSKGMIMKAIKQRYDGKIDMKIASQIVDLIMKEGI